MEMFTPLFILNFADSTSQSFLFDHSVDTVKSNSSNFKQFSRSAASLILAILWWKTRCSNVHQEVRTACRFVFNALTYLSFLPKIELC